MFTRRQMIAGAASLPVALPSSGILAQSATPAATPSIASPPTTADFLPAWLQAQESLRQRGEAISAAFWNSDGEAIREYASTQLRAFIPAEINASNDLAIFTTNQLHFALHQVGGWFFGQFEPTAITGFYNQNGTNLWMVTPEEPQTGEVPTGKWTGFIGPGTIDLGIELEFAGTADDLEIFLTIPSQEARNEPMDDVVFAAEMPIGDLVDVRVLPAGGSVTPVNMYAEQYAWGPNTIMFLTSWSEEGELSGFTFIPQGTLPEVDTPDAISARLPFDGAWTVFWGGDTEFRNYHAVTAPQRYAVDLMIWQDGSTAVEPGRRNEHYHAFGQPYLAPVDGTVVAVMDGQEDIRPQTSGSNPDVHPAGNHVVIETDGGYVFLAHCRNGSIVVAEGDAVAAGETVAAVGNSGNTSEPHVHIHAQSSPDMFDPAAVGIPLLFEGAMENAEAVEELSAQQGTIVEHIS